MMRLYQPTGWFHTEMLLMVAKVTNHTTKAYQLHSGGYREQKSKVGETLPNPFLQLCLNII